MSTFESKYFFNKSLTHVLQRWSLLFHKQYPVLNESPLRNVLEELNSSLIVNSYLLKPFVDLLKHQRDTPWLESPLPLGCTNSDFDRVIKHWD